MKLLLLVMARSSDKIVLDASPSTDPDQHQLRFEWLIYPEPGTFRGQVPTIENAMSPQATLVAPQVDSRQTLHIILMVTDDGTPPLTRYRRVVLTVDP